MLDMLDFCLFGLNVFLLHIACLLYLPDHFSDVELLETHEVNVALVLSQLCLLVLIPIALHLLEVAQSRTLVAHVVAAEVTPIPLSFLAERLLAERALLSFNT